MTGRNCDCENGDVSVSYVRSSHAGTGTKGKLRMETKLFTFITSFFFKYCWILRLIFSFSFSCLSHNNMFSSSQVWVTEHFSWQANQVYFGLWWKKKEIQKTGHRRTQRTPSISSSVPSHSNHRSTELKFATDFLSSLWSISEALKS